MLFNQAHPGSLGRPDRQLDQGLRLMLSWDLDVVVPGHGAG
jgi:hypothetical protein